MSRSTPSELACFSSTCFSVYTGRLGDSGRAGLSWRHNRNKPIAVTPLSDARRAVWLCRPGRNEAAARWVAPISRGGPYWAPGGGGGEAGRSRGQGALCVSCCSPRQYQPGLTHSSMLVPGSTRPSSKRKVRATCRRLGRRDAEVSSVVGSESEVSKTAWGEWALEM